MSTNEAVLDQDTLCNFAMAKVFKYNNCVINGLDTDDSGRYLVTSSTDNCVRLYDCLDAKLRKTIECNQFGASCIQFTHHSKSVLLATHDGSVAKNNNSSDKNSKTNNGTTSSASSDTNTKKSSDHDNIVRYLSLHDNAYIRSFYGHSDRITQICLSHLDDSFMTASIDRHVRMWDLRQSEGVAVCKVAHRPTVCLDPEGLVFGIGTGSNELKLYDRRKYQHGPFATVRNFPTCNHEWCDMRFSPDGKYILVSTRTNLVSVIDSIDGHLLAQYSSYKNTNFEDIVASFTPNADFIACGSSNGDIHFWNWKKMDAQYQTQREGADDNPEASWPPQSRNDPYKVTTWKGHPRSIRYFQWNPKYMTAVSAAQHVALWLPRNTTYDSEHSQQTIKKSNLKKTTSP